jgi:hypothetical protein
MHSPKKLTHKKSKNRGHTVKQQNQDGEKASAQTKESAYQTAFKYYLKGQNGSKKQEQKKHAYARKIDKPKQFMLYTANNRAQTLINR